VRSDAWLAEATPSIKPGCSAAAGIDGQVVWADAPWIGRHRCLHTPHRRHPVRH
jgi:hypothetical protein